MDATRVVNVWLANDEPLYRRVMDLAVLHPNRPDLADALKEFVGGELRERYVSGESSMFSDLVSHALADVDWDDIAEGWLE
jgi:hypothetical protein